MYTKDDLEWYIIRVNMPATESRLWSDARLSQEEYKKIDEMESYYFNLHKNSPSLP